MSFSDMMSSGRGPGVIGMVLALIVLLGFGVLFMFAFDEGFQGGEQTIESVIAGQTREIDGFKSRLAEIEKQLATAPARTADARKVSITKAENNAGKETLARLTRNVEAAKADIEDRVKKFADYKDQYRQFVRSNAADKTMDKLVTTTGATYTGVSIREVTAIGMQIRHSEGQKRIPFEELPDDLKDYYQFDASQAQAAASDEMAKRKEHDAQAALSTEAESAAMAVQREKQQAAAKEKLAGEVAQLEATLQGLQAEIKQLERDQQKEEADAAAAKAAGRRGLVQTGSIGRNIASKRSRATELQAKIASMKAQL